MMDSTLSPKRETTSAFFQDTPFFRESRYSSDPPCPEVNHSSLAALRSARCEVKVFWGAEVG